RLLLPMIPQPLTHTLFPYTTLFRSRCYNSAAKLNFHTDNCDVVGLLCLRTARSGGLSRITSSMSIFNRFMAQRPELLDVLFEGLDRKSTRLNSSHVKISYAVFCLKK